MEFIENFPPVMWGRFPACFGLGHWGDGIWPGWGRFWWAKPYLVVPFLILIWARRQWTGLLRRHIGHSMNVSVGRALVNCRSILIYYKYFGPVWKPIRFCFFVFTKFKNKKIFSFSFILKQKDVWLKLTTFEKIENRKWKCVWCFDARTNLIASTRDCIQYRAAGMWDEYNP